MTVWDGTNISEIMNDTIIVRFVTDDGMMVHLADVMRSVSEVGLAYYNHVQLEVCNLFGDDWVAVPLGALVEL